MPNHPVLSSTGQFAHPIFYSDAALKSRLYKILHSIYSVTYIMVQ